MRRTAGTAASAVLMAFAVGTGRPPKTPTSARWRYRRSGGKPVSVPLTVTVREYTSDSRANAAGGCCCNDRGHAAAASELAKDDIGQVQLGDGAPFRVTLARQEPTGKTGRCLRW